LRESTKYRFAVFFIGSDKNIEIFGCPWLCMNAESIAAYDQVFNCVIVECA